MSAVNPQSWRPLAYAGLMAAALGLLLVASFGGGGHESELERVQRLNDSFACPVCDGESVAASNTAVSANIRQFIDEQVQAGSTDQEIRDALLAAYKVDILLNPPADGFAGLVWILPVVMGSLGAVAAAAAMTRARRAGRKATDDDRRLVEEARQVVVE